MRKATLTLALALAAALLALAASAQEAVRLEGGRVSFVPPAGFQPMTREDILTKFPRRGAAGAPEMVYSNERMSVSVAVGFSGQNIPADKLEEVKGLLEADFARSVPGIEWRTREIIELGGVKWIHFGMKSPAVDTDIVNDLYVTIFDGRLLIFNFNSTVALFDAHRESLEKSARSITVKP